MVERFEARRLSRSRSLSLIISSFRFISYLHNKLTRYLLIRHGRGRSRGLGFSVNSRLRSHRVVYRT